MIRFDDTHITSLLEAKQNASVKVHTLGKFVLEIDKLKLADQWGRDKVIQLFQFLLISRNRTALHKEQIIDRLWEDEGTDQDFKVALHGINKVLEPERKARGKSKFMIRQGSSYKLNMDEIWLDSHAMESFLEIGDNLVGRQNELAIMSYQCGVDLYGGSFLPNRIYQDWTSTEREKLQMLAINGTIKLANLLVEERPDESLRLTQNILSIDPTWEEAYRIQMMAHMINGNRAQAIRCYNKCKAVLEKEFGIEPLPITRQLLHSIQNQ